MLTGLLSSVAVFVTEKVAAFGFKWSFAGVRSLAGKFASNKQALAIGGIVGAAIIFEAGSFHGYAKAVKQANEAATITKLHTVQRDLEIQKQTADAAAAERDKLAKLNSDLQGKVQTYEDALSTRKAPACNLDDSDVRRLRALH